MDGNDLGEGLIILRASRLEALVAPLYIGLEATRPEGLLAPQTIVAAHPGVRQWLSGALARHVGADRAVANLDVLLPSAWLDRLSERLLGRKAIALPHYRRANLRWTLHALLENPPQGVDEPRMLAYLQRPGSPDEQAQRRFQLADRLAGVYSQYLAYRSDWLLAWEAGGVSHATAAAEDAAQQALESRLLAPLWQHVAARLGPHRASLMQALHDALANPGATLEPLHVFGLSHLPPVELEVLRRYARQAPVFLYVPDPCREYWGGLRAPQGDGRWRTPDTAAWEAYRTTESTRLAEGAPADPAQPHPLLARWGRMGQHFFAALADGAGREDTRHWQDEQPAEPVDRLGRLQESIRRLDAGLIGEDVAASAARADASLRIHACHTRLRELEVLRDALLDAVEAGIRPGEIVVMAPDIQSYLPLIPAVFGEPGSARERLLPYHLADVPVASSHPLFRIFEDLLALGASRLTAAEVVDLLAVPEVRRALGLDEEEAETLEAWIRASRVAWGLDGAHKQALHLPARSEFSFAWAMDRMLAGYLMADDSNVNGQTAVELHDTTRLLPLAGIEGPAAAGVGGLQRLLGELWIWRDLAQKERTASDWATTLLARVEALFRIDPTDSEARAALSAIRRAVGQLGAEPGRNGHDPVLRLAVVADLLRDALAAAPERQRFLLGGITFCGMVPQRAIPFGMVCVLGLNEGEFPRQRADGGVDLMPHFRRIGDRDAPGDDRYLFLETVMSARRRLHLSYIGQGVRDGKPRNPAAPLAELLAELDRRCGVAIDADDDRRPWLVRHPLQPFDDRYFNPASDRDTALFSYSRRFASMHGRGEKPLPRFREDSAGQPDQWPEQLPLKDLVDYFKDPAKHILRSGLELSLDALDDDAELPEDEPLEGLARVHDVARKVFLRQVLPRACAEPAWEWDGAVPDWVSFGGLLPLGSEGEATWHAEADAVLALRERADATGRFDARGAAGARAIRVDVPLLPPGAPSPVRVTGTVRNVFPLKEHEDGLQVVFAYPKPGKNGPLKEAEEISFRDQVPAFLQWALLRLRTCATTPVRLTLLAKDEPDLASGANAWDEGFIVADDDTRREMADDLQYRIGLLLSFWRDGRAGRSRYYPRTGWAVVRKLKEEEANSPTPLDEDARLRIASNASRAKWLTQQLDSPGERDYAPGYALLLEGDLAFGDSESDPEATALKQLMEDCMRLDALLSLGAAADVAQDTMEAPDDQQ